MANIQLMICKDTFKNFVLVEILGLRLWNGVL